jgi:serine/threonine protein phosphatase PrpC
MVVIGELKIYHWSRAFGDLDSTPFVTHLPQVYKYKISSSDKFLVFACDGLWDVLSNQDVVDCINTLINEKYKGNFAKKIAELALAKGSLDNVTIIIYIF